MRAYSSAIRQIIDSGSISIFYLVEILGKTFTIRHTNLPYDVSVAAIGDFSSSNTLKGVEAPRQSSVVDREAYKITYSDNSYDMAGVFAAGITGAKVSVYIGFMNTTENTIGAAPPGFPILDKNDMIVGYKGFVDAPSHTVNPDGEVTAVIECSSPMADLGLVKPFVTSPEQVHRVDPTDTCMDEVFTGSSKVELEWGKIRTDNSRANRVGMVYNTLSGIKLFGG